MGRRRTEPIKDEDRVIKDAAKARERTMHRAVRLLAAKPRSVGELRTRLMEKAWTNLEIVDAVIEKLQEYGYLDDAKYAEGLANAKLREKPQGRRRLKWTMSRKELDPETVDQAIDSAYEKMPEEDLADLAIEKRVRLKGVPKTREDLKKFYDHLMRQGFSYGMIRDKVAALPRAQDEDE